jgi:hypothetical protein
MDRSTSRRTTLGSSGFRRLVLVAGLVVASAASVAPAQATLCGGANYPFPYTDVSGVGAKFCPGIMEAYVTGVSKGTTPTTFSPNELVPRLQMTTFLQRSLDQGLARTSRRAALEQWWTPQNTKAIRTIVVGVGIPFGCAADGENIWVSTSTQVVEVQASTGIILGTWAIPNATGVRVALGSVLVASASPSYLYALNPMSPGSSNVSGPIGGAQPIGVAFDGINVWMANRGPPGSVSILDAFDFSGTTVATGFNAPYGILYDGAHIWVTDTGAGTLLKLDPVGNILQTVTVGTLPGFPVFDGANIWVPNYTDDSITVVQASTGNVVATITLDASNQLDGPNGASFDGERILVANYNGQSVTLFKAADLSFIANVPVTDSLGGAQKPVSGCSDGINFWLPLPNGELLRF